MTSRTGMTTARWAYLKALRPGFGHYMHVSRGLVPVKGEDGIVRLAPWPKGQGKTYNVGRNKAKREAKVRANGLRTRINRISAVSTSSQTLRDAP